MLPVTPLNAALDQQASATADEQIVDDIAERGYAICRDFLPLAGIQALMERVRENEADEALQTAGIGRGKDFQTNPFVRQDKIRWLGGQSPAEAAFLARMETLRLSMNRHLFLGLFDYEAHFALYPEGAFYKKHVDAFKGRTNRRLSTVLYLNFGWQPLDGGELRCYDPEDTDKVLFDLAPEAGTLLVFESERFWHEVLPAQRARASIAGWFRVNASTGQFVDPPK